MWEPDGRHELFETARKRSENTITQVWVAYLALGGRMDLFTVEAYLHGLAPLPPAEQDALANAVNEELDDLFQATKVPYLQTVDVLEPLYEDAVEVLNELLGRGGRRPDPLPGL